ncbi:MAG: type II 3-dehydroquinate dehydratase [Candidatus Ratteibacteria bacterium]|nr:type II 3-dehydroquinate dehydratase [Candidatus Ratteibacteria bacterium]
MNKILVVHGPNLDLLGEREPGIYGKDTLETINSLLKKEAQKNNVELKVFQSNGEGDIVNFLRDNRKWAEGIILNPAAYTHTSVAIRDAVKALNIPTVEVHLSNIYAREEFRQKSLIAPVAVATISGFGKQSYILALYGLLNLIKDKG